MSSNGWREMRLCEGIEFNPRESISKGVVAKKVAMERLMPFSKIINGYELAKYKGGSKFRNGDTLLARITPCLENGKTAKVTILDNDEIGYGSTEFIVMRGKVNKTDDDFIYYLSISPVFRDIAIKSMVGTSGRQRVQQDILENIRMPIPGVCEQKAIAATLSCLDDKIELNNRINKTLEEMAQAIFKSWFVDFEPFQNGEFIDSELGKIPKGWRVSSLDSIACYMNGIAMQKYKPEAEEFLPVIKIKELNQGFTDNNSDKASINIPEQHIIRNGDVLFSWSGTLLVKIWAGDIGGLNQHLFKVTSENYDKWFYYLWTLNYLDKFRAIAEDKATTMGHIKRKHLSEAMVLIPKFSDMNYMSNIMNPVIDKITELNSQNSCIRLIRDALLPKLMSGEVRVPIEEVL
jgi:type I restriction enzyme S subunit